MTVVDYELLVRAIQNQIGAALLCVVVIMLGTSAVPQIITAARTRNWRLYTNPAVFGMLGMFVKNVSEAMRTSWTAVAQIARIYGHNLDTWWPIIVFAGYIGSTMEVIGCILLIRAFAPQRWSNSGMIAVGMGILILVAATYAPLIGRARLQF